MSVLQTAALTHDQRNVLKTYIPAFKIVHSGLVEEQEAFWATLFSEWFTIWPKGSTHYPDNHLPSALQQVLIDKAIQRRHQVRHLIFEEGGQIFTVHKVHLNFHTYECPREINAEGIFSCQEVTKGINRVAV